MGFEHWIMENFGMVIMISLVIIVAGHFAVVWLLRQTGRQDTDKDND